MRNSGLTRPSIGDALSVITTRLGVSPELGRERHDALEGVVMTHLAAHARWVWFCGGSRSHRRVRWRLGSLCLAPDFLSTRSALAWSATLKTPVVRPPGAPLVT